MNGRYLKSGNLIKNILFPILLFHLSVPGYAQNLLSPIWKYHDIDDEEEVVCLHDKNWQEVNLLLSWERQGYCESDRKCVIKNHFFVNEADTNLQLEFSFPAKVKAVCINHVRISGKVPDLFWTNRGNKTIIAVPDSILRRNSGNKIMVIFDNVSYTGGISHNICSLHPAGAGFRDSVSISFPSRDHVYLQNDSRQFIIHSENTSDSKLRIIINNDFHDTLVNDTVCMSKGKHDYVYDLAEKNLEPGLYECIVISESHSFCGTAEWFAVQPEDISCSAQKVPGFDEYWRKAMSELNMIDPGFKVTRVDSLCSSTRDGYVAEMNSLGDVTIRAYYFVPKTQGKHPVILHLPGYSYGFEYLEGMINNNSNIAELALCVRGHGISRDLFSPWDTITLWGAGICNKDEYVYRAIYMDCVRAVDFLLSRPEIDNTRIGVEGGSQGGGLALATAGLCNLVIAACAVFDPWLCDIRHQGAIRTMINKELDAFAQYPSNNCSIDQMYTVLGFMDTKYFANDIKCPVYFSTSLFDDDCPPHCGFSVYNNLMTKKSYKVYPDDSHLGESGQYSDLSGALEKMLLNL